MRADHFMGLMRHSLWRAHRAIARAAGLVGAGVLLSVAGLAPAAASEHESGWTVSEVLGSVRHAQQAGVWWSARSGDALPAGSVVVTGDDGHLTLTRGVDRIDVSPSSEFTIAGEPEGEGESIMQRLGKLLFDMESQESRKFRVDTPYLAAAIKGTVFSVTVTGDAATVDVEEGYVEVSHRSSGEKATVGAGGRASAGRGLRGLAAQPGKRADSGVPTRVDPANGAADDDESASAGDTPNAKGPKKDKKPGQPDKPGDDNTVGGKRIEIAPGNGVAGGGAGGAASDDDADATAARGLLRSRDGDASGDDGTSAGGAGDAGDAGGGGGVGGAGGGSRGGAGDGGSGDDGGGTGGGGGVGGGGRSVGLDAPATGQPVLPSARVL